MELRVIQPDHCPVGPPLPLLQSPLSARALGPVASIVLIVDQGHPLGHALLLRRAGITATLRGPVWHPATPPATRRAALRALRRQGLRLVEAEDATAAADLHAAGFRRVATPAHVAELDLVPDADFRRRALDAKWRNHLRRAERAGLTLRQRPLSGASDPFLAAETAQRRARRYRAIPTAFAAACGPAATLAEAWTGTTLLAAMLFLRHGNSATYHIGWTTSQGRAAEAHRLILWHMAGVLADAGCLRLDLGTVDSVTNPGLASFKLGTGARLRPLGGSFLALPFL